MTALSAVRIADASRDVRWFHNGGYHRPGVSGFAGTGVSRPTLEAAVRARVLALPSVRALENVDVRGLEGAGERVTGVRLIDREENGRSHLAPRFFNQADKIINEAWETAVGADLGFSEIEGPRPPMTRFLNWYMGKLHAAAHNDAQVSIAFLKVINMLTPPPSVIGPRILWRVLKGNLRPGQEKNRTGNLLNRRREQIIEQGDYTSDPTTIW